MEIRKLQLLKQEVEKSFQRKEIKPVSEDCWHLQSNPQSVPVHFPLNTNLKSVWTVAEGLISDSTEGNGNWRTANTIVHK